MEQRDSFLFYRSFYEAIKCMPQEVQAEIYPARMDYVFFEKQPKNLSEIAKGVFILIKPNIDVNLSRRENGKKGGQYGKLGGRPRKKPKEVVEVEQTPPYNLSFAEEAEKMKCEEIFIDGVCKNFQIDKNEIAYRLDRFAVHCNTECSDKPHTSIADAKRHFTSWMRKAYTDKPLETPVDSIPDPPDYTYKGGFGSIDV